MNKKTLSASGPVVKVEKRFLHLSGRQTEVTPLAFFIEIELSGAMISISVCLPPVYSYKYGGHPKHFQCLK